LMICENSLVRHKPDPLTGWRATTCFCPIVLCRKPCRLRSSTIPTSSSSVISPSSSLSWFRKLSSLALAITFRPPFSIDFKHPHKLGRRGLRGPPLRWFGFGFLSKLIIECSREFHSCGAGCGSFTHPCDRLLELGGNGAGAPVRAVKLGCEKFFCNSVIAA